MTCTRTFTTLRIFSEDISPERISDILGVEATKVFPIDTDSKSRSRRETNLWKWCTEEHLDSSDNLKHIWVVLNLLKGKVEQLDQLRSKGCKIDLVNFWDSSGQGGPSLDLTTMSALIRLGLEILWDVYFDHETET